MSRVEHTPHPEGKGFSSSRVCHCGSLPIKSGPAPPERQHGSRVAVRGWEVGMRGCSCFRHF